MTINTDLLLAIREQITSHPEAHDQREWGVRTECGTTHCIAGWAAVLTGATIDWRGSEGGHRVYLVDDEDPEVYAAGMLGLDHDEAHSLFYERDNAAALRRLDILIEKGKNAA
ncbi:hypothetical protein [Streptomyces sp. NRRL S-920]|uniref:hypothetical protein n=1 Tax=Streptomyces sp. NRRL S-920 TaxID=1463921 RepID=UPI00068B0DB7|nr:hypothetical protein [Streptomyces sp. NRRL S-920]